MTSSTIAWIRRFVELLLEVNDGRRPRRHLRPLVHPELFGRLGQVSDWTSTTTVDSIRLQSRRGVHEAAVVLTHHNAGRVYVTSLALSVRLVDGAWLVTEANAPGAVVGDPFIETELPDPSPTWSDLAVVDRIEPQSSPGWQMPVGWRQPSRAA